MIKKLKKNNIELWLHTDLLINDDDDNNNNYSDMLDKIYDETQIYIENNYDKLQQEKYLYPLVILIFDDMWKYLKNNNILSQMAKNGRHLRLCIFIAWQYFMDLWIDVRANLSHIILFSSIGEKKLKDIYEEKIISSDINNFDKFLDIYNAATDKKYDFLFVDVFNNKFYKNFNYLIDVK